jgi:hypothetical protein
MENEQQYNSVDDNQNQEYLGEVVYIYAFDIAYEMKQPPATKLLGQSLENYFIRPGKCSPKRSKISI